MGNQEHVPVARPGIDVGHHGEEPDALQVEVGIDTDDGVAAYFHLVVGCLQVELLDSGITDVIGFIKEIDADFCKLGCVDFYGNDEGTVYIRTDKITKISCGSEDEKIAKTLWDYKSRGETGA